MEARLRSRPQSFDPKAAMRWTIRDLAVSLNININNTN
jgi:hypothetical protein